MLSNFDLHSFLLPHFFFLSPHINSVNQGMPVLDIRNLRNKLKKPFCYQKLFRPFTVCLNCSSDLKNFANSWPSISKFKSFCRPLEHFFSQWVRIILVEKYHFHLKYPQSSASKNATTRHYITQFTHHHRITFHHQIPPNPYQKGLDLSSTEAYEHLILSRII